MSGTPSEDGSPSRKHRVKSKKAKAEVRKSLDAFLFFGKDVLKGSFCENFQSLLTAPRWITQYTLFKASGCIPPRISFLLTSDFRRWLVIIACLIWCSVFHRQIGSGLICHTPQFLKCIKQAGGMQGLQNLIFLKHLFHFINAEQINFNFFIVV